MALCSLRNACSTGKRALYSLKSTNSQTHPTRDASALIEFSENHQRCTGGRSVLQDLIVAVVGTIRRRQDEAAAGGEQAHSVLNCGDRVFEMFDHLNHDNAIESLLGRASIRLYRFGLIEVAVCACRLGYCFLRYVDAHNVIAASFESIGKISKATSRLKDRNCAVLGQRLVDAPRGVNTRGQVMQWISCANDMPCILKIPIVTWGAAGHGVNGVVDPWIDLTGIGNHRETPAAIQNRVGIRLLIARHAPRIGERAAADIAESFQVQAPELPYVAYGSCLVTSHVEFSSQ